MESLGIVRKIDETGRIVLPKDFRRRLALEPNADAVELFADGDQIIIRKYAARCIFCGSSDDKDCSSRLSEVIRLQSK